MLHRDFLPEVEISRAEKPDTKPLIDPIIFRPLKSLTLANSQQSTLLRLAQAGISVYSPHTAVDAATGGLNDYLVDIVTRSGFRDNKKHTSSVITPVPSPPAGHEKAGYGRIVRFEEPQLLRDIMKNVQRELCLPFINVAVPQTVDNKDVAKHLKTQIQISSVGICAGSGGSMLNGLDVDCLVTGELSHHEALAAIEQEKSVITTFHSNSERAFLAAVMRAKLKEAVDQEIDANMMAEDVQVKELKDWRIFISKIDRDPYEVWTDAPAIDTW